MFTRNAESSEIDIHTAEAMFPWWTLDYVHPAESLVDHHDGTGSYGPPQGFYHLNSVGQKANEITSTLLGAQVLSTRSLARVYIIWRFGGKKSESPL